MSRRNAVFDHFPVAGSESLIAPVAVLHQQIPSVTQPAGRHVPKTGGAKKAKSATKTEFIADATINEF